MFDVHRERVATVRAVRFRRSGWLISWVAVLAVLGICGAESEPGSAGVAAEAVPPPTAEALLRQVRERLPAKPVRIEGALEVRRKHGVPLAELDFQLEADWGASPVQLQGLLRDPDGREVENLRISFEPGQPPSVTRANATDGRGVLAELTDLTWADFTLAFLWWPNPQLAGRDEVRGRACTLVDIPAPPWAAKDLGADYARVRVWVDDEAGFLMQTESYTPDGQARRRLWVRSLKKVEGHWMVKDMEVQGYPAVQRTRVRVHSIQGVTP